MQSTPLNPPSDIVLSSLPPTHQNTSLTPHQRDRTNRTSKSHLQIKPSRQAGRRANRQALQYSLIVDLQYVLQLAHLSNLPPLFPPPPSPLSLFLFPFPFRFPRKQNSKAGSQLKGYNAAVLFPSKKKKNIHACLPAPREPTLCYAMPCCSLRLMLSLVV